MIIEDSYLDFLILNRLTQPQFLLLHLIYKKRIDLLRKYKQAFPTDDGTIIGKRLTDELIQRGFLIIKEEGGGFEIGKEFLKLYIDSREATEQIFRIYPTYYHKSGLDIPLNIMDRRTFSKIYEEAIIYSNAEHIEVIKDIKYGKLHNLIIIPIDKFVKSHYWKVLRKQRLDYENTPQIDEYSLSVPQPENDSYSEPAF